MKNKRILYLIYTLLFLAYAIGVMTVPEHRATGRNIIGRKVVKTVMNTKEMVNSFVEVENEKKKN